MKPDYFNRKIPSKKNILAHFISYSGLLHLLEFVPSKPQLIVLNYHRIGNEAETLFDQGVFSASVAGLDEQIRILKAKYKFVSPLQALDIIEGRQKINETVLLLTFDDGYRDNYLNAFPVLKSHGVKAIFFLVTSYIEERIVPWWDQIAFLARRHAPKPLRLVYPRDDCFDLSPEHFNNELRRLLTTFKSQLTLEPERFLSELECVVEFRREDIFANLFMSWEEMRAMQASGMMIGLHSHSHRILAKLSPHEQRQELILCKSILERELNEEVTVLAYPVGAKDSFNSDSKRIAEEIGLRAAFSFYGGMNLQSDLQRFDVRRVAFDKFAPVKTAQLAVSALAIMGFSGFMASKNGAQ